MALIIEKSNAWAITFQNSAGATGNGRTLQVDGVTSCSVQVRGLSASTVVFEGTVDGTNWVSVQAMNITTGAQSTSTTSNGVFIVNTAGLGYFRCRVSAYGGGDTIIVTGIATALSGSIASSGGGGGAMTVADGADVALGATTDTSAAADNSSTTVIAFLKRLCARITAFIALVPSALTGSGNFKVALVESTAATTVSQSTATNLRSMSYPMTGQIIDENQNQVTIKRTFATVAASQTDANVITAVASRKLRILSVVFVCDSNATNIVFNSKSGGAGTAISPTFYNGANGGATLPENYGGWMQTNSGEGLSATTGAGGNTGVLVTYVELP